MKNIIKVFIFLTAFVFCFTTCDTPTNGTNKTTEEGTLFAYAGTASSLEIANNSRGYTFPDTFLSESDEVSITIKNTGKGTIKLTGTPYIKLDGATAVFSVSTPPESSTISPGTSISFTIKFSPLTATESYVYVLIPNNSKNAPDFSFTIYGKGMLKKPQIVIQQNNTTINLYGEYNFGSILGGKSSDITFTIKNSGTANLNIITVNDNRINLDDTITEQFIVIKQPSMIIIPGGTETFIIRFSPTADGIIFTAIVHIKTDSQNDSDFYFSIKGTRRDYYIIGDSGPAGGIIFYDAGAVVNGWRYLEAALIDFSAQWGALGVDIAGTGLSIGSGKQNTLIIVETLNQLGETGRAAQLCSNLNFGGYTDWFLPSRDELNLLYQNLHKTGLGGFSSEYYFSSSSLKDNYNSLVLVQDFRDGHNDVRTYRHIIHLVRAVRAFSL
jgi:hypothetical protein